MSENVILYIISTIDAILSAIIWYFFTKLSNINDRVLTLENNTSSDMRYMKEKIENIYREVNQKVDEIRSDVKELKEYVHNQTHDFNNQRQLNSTLINRVTDLVEALEKKR